MLAMRAQMSGNVPPVVQSSFINALNDYSTLSTVSSMPSGGSITRAGNAMVYDSTGKLTWAPNNQYINSGSATNTARTITTVAGVNYYIWIQTSTGTATIVASGTNTTTFNGSTSGTFTAFTATAGTLTLTPTSNFANITQVVVAQITYETALRSGDNYVTGAAAYYGPRFDYDPATLAAKGLLVEGTRTNSMLQSNNFVGPTYSINGMTITATSAVTSPDGLTNGWIAQRSSASNAFGQAASLTSGTTHTISIYAKAGTGNVFELHLATAGFAEGASASVNLSAQTVTITNYGTVTGSTAAIKSIGNGWFRCSLTATLTSTATWYREYALSDTGTLYFFGAQVEAGAFPTSYIPTTADAVARAAETFSITGYVGKLVESFYIDAATGGSWSANINASSTSPLTISTPTFGWVTSLRAYTNAYAGDITTPSWIDNSGTTGNRMYYDSTGALTWAPSNMLLNSATLSTQTVTVTSGATNILSFSGTGSITYSGAASGTLSGTGVSNRVSVALTMTTASLTLTVSGSVTSAQLERVTYQTSPRAYIPTTSAAVYQPRYDYNPATVPATPSGMLIEESRANILTYSDQFDNAAWIKSGVLAFGSGSVANAVTAPDGTSSADKIVENTTSSTVHYVGQTPTISASTAYTFSMYAKSAGRTKIVLSLGGYFFDRSVTFDLVAGSYTINSSSITASITNVGNGWYRCSVVSTSGGGTISSVLVFTADASGNTTYTGDGVSGVYLWQSQFEAGSFVTSPIPTTSASVTRVADVVKLSGSAFTVTANNPATAAVEYLLPNNQSSRRILWANELSSGNYTNNVRITNDNVGLVAAGVDKTKSIAYTSGQINRLIMGWGGAGWSAYQNAGTLQTDTSAMPTGISDTRLGSHNDGVYMNGYVRSLALYSQRLPDTILKQKSSVNTPY